MNLGWTELLILIGLLLLLFGPSKLPGLGKSMGEAIRGFKKGIKGEGDSHPTRDVKEHLDHSHQSQSAEKQNDKQRQS